METCTRTGLFRIRSDAPVLDDSSGASIIRPYRVFAAVVVHADIVEHVREDVKHGLALLSGVPPSVRSAQLDVQDVFHHVYVYLRRSQNG